MAYTTIKKPTDYFNTLDYNGNGSNRSIIDVGFQPDWVWLKRRDQASFHYIFDSIRGVQKKISSNSTAAETTVSTSLTSFDSDGFGLGAEGDVNESGGTYVSWNWLGGGTGVSNTDGSISSTVSANTTSGFSIVSWTGNGGTASVGHGLGVKPNIVIKKNRDAATNWIFSTTIIDGSNDFFYLNSTDAKGDSAETAPTASLVNLFANSENNGNGNDMIAYCFAEKQGFSKFGSYVGNGNADGTFVYTGFKPAFVIIKPSSYANSWLILDNKRNTFNPTNTRLEADGTGADYSGLDYADFLSNGFKIRTGNAHPNTSGGTLIYMAFAEEPLVGDNPATAR